LNSVLLCLIDDDVARTDKAMTRIVVMRMQEETKQQQPQQQQQQREEQDLFECKADKRVLVCGWHASGTNE
jgi:hypothetical protein